MRFLSVTAATLLLAASCGLANAQATKFSRTPADAQTMGNSSDTRTYYRGERQYYGWNDYGWNSYGARVGVGAWPEYNYVWPEYRYGPRTEYYGPPHRQY
jgi:hypothetical protein